jgi:hypothetical protein
VFGRTAPSSEKRGFAGIGPITVDPNVQDRGLGRRLMLAVMERVSTCFAADWWGMRSKVLCRAGPESDRTHRECY